MFRGAFRAASAAAALAAAPALAAAFVPTAAAAGAATAPAPALSKDEFRSFKLVRAEQVTPDTKRLTFALPHESDEAGLATASCLVVRATVDGAFTAAAAAALARLAGLALF
jgi:hypothetical protein